MYIDVVAYRASVCLAKRHESRPNRRENNNNNY